jgi:hypothetical protein
MYSEQFIKYLVNYQKEEFKPKEEEAKKELHFRNKVNKVYATVPSSSK